MLQELKRFDAALTNYDKAIVLKPENAEAFYNRGNALKELKRLEEALESYRKGDQPQSRQRRRLQQPRHCSSGTQAV